MKHLPILTVALLSCAGTPAPEANSGAEHSAPDQPLAATSAASDDEQVSKPKPSPQLDRVFKILCMKVDPAYSIVTEDDTLVMAPELGWIGVRPEGKSIIARDLFSGRVIAPEGARCLGFRSANKEAWFVRSGGVVDVVTLDEGASRRTVSLGKDATIDAIEFSPDGAAFAVLDREAATVYLYRVEGDGQPKEIAVFTDVGAATFGRTPVSPFCFSGDSSRFAFTLQARVTKPNDEKKTDGGGRVVDTRSGEVLHSFSPYLAKRSRGFLFADSSIATSRRENSYDWRLVLEGPGKAPVADGEATTDEASTIVIDADSRGGHFTDLFLAPSGRWLAEGDFEDRAPRIYDLDNPGSYAQLDKGAGLPLGFDVSSDDSAPLFFVGDVNARLRLFKTNGELLLDEHPELRRSLPGRAKFQFAHATTNGKVIVLMSWAGLEDRVGIRYELRVLRYEGPRR